MPEINYEDTIAAIATPLGEGGISVIRVSGEKAWELVDSVFRSANKKPLLDCKANTTHFGAIHDGKKLVDQVLISLFKAPHSYTGEDIVEISSHGGLIVTKQVLDLLLSRGARFAEPGEFTRRAFLSGKIDLTQAEAVLDLIKAKSTLSADVAAKQLAGTLSSKLKALRDDLMKIYAHIEAYVDFPEDDLEVYDNQDFVTKIDQAKSEIQKLIQSFKRGSLLREGISIVIIGRPNAGKSSLFNAILERDRALVSEHEGTTRDLIEENIEVRGLYARLIDTAGLALKSDNPLDKMGIEKTREITRHADLYLYVVDGSEALNEQDKEAFGEMDPEKPKLVLINKSDLARKLNPQELKQFVFSARHPERSEGSLDRDSSSQAPQNDETSFINVSALKTEGFEVLEEKIYEMILGSNLQVSGEQVTRLRHKNALEQSLEALERTKEAFSEKKSVELIALEIKAALDALRELIGEVYSEDLLDVIFSEFCIGK